MPAAVPPAHQAIPRAGICRYREEHPFLAFCSTSVIPEAPVKRTQILLFCYHSIGRQEACVPARYYVSLAPA
jgi:hypothetical protein